MCVRNGDVFRSHGFYFIFTLFYLCDVLFFFLLLFCFFDDSCDATQFSLLTIVTGVFWYVLCERLTEPRGRFRCLIVFYVSMKRFGLSFKSSLLTEANIYVYKSIICIICCPMVI